MSLIHNMKTHVLKSNEKVESPFQQYWETRGNSEVMGGGMGHILTTPTKLYMT